MHADVEDITSGALSGCEDYYTECILTLRGSLLSQQLICTACGPKVSEQTQFLPVGFQIGVWSLYTAYDILESIQ